jgi:uroporphyrinogen decarboxylase
MKNAIFQEIIRSVVDGQYEVIADLCQRALSEGHSGAEITRHALSRGMTQSAKRYASRGMYLDSILWSATAFHAGLAALPAEPSPAPGAGKVVLAVLDGPWTLGKDIAAAVLRAHGFEVIDAGADVSPAAVIDAVRAHNADLVAIGLYLSYRGDRVRELDELLFRSGLRPTTPLVLSGPSANRKLARELGADAYAKTAEEVVEIANELIGRRRSAMTSRERVMTSLALREPDRVPVVPFAMTFPARFAGIPFRAYVSDGAALAEAEVRTARAFGWDAAIVSSDVAAYASAFGAEAYMPEDDVPRLTGAAIRLDSARSDFEKLDKPETYLERGRVSEMIRAVGLIKREVGDDLAVIGWTEGPFQGSMLLLGADPGAIFLSRQDPGLLKEIIAWYGEFEFAVAKAMIDAGADIIAAGESVGYFLSPEMFREYVYPFEKATFKKISDYGAPVLIHCCGHVPQCIKFAPEVNPGGAIQFDYQVNLGRAKKQIGDRITIMGNLDCNRLLHLGSVDDVDKACRKAIEQAGRNGGFWLSGGCEIPRDMPYENMQAMVESAKKYGQYPIGEEPSES